MDGFCFASCYLGNWWIFAWDMDGRMDGWMASDMVLGGYHDILLSLANHGFTTHDVIFIELAGMLCYYEIFTEDPWLESGSCWWLAGRFVILVRNSILRLTCILVFFFYVFFGMCRYEIWYPAGGVLMCIAMCVSLPRYFSLVPEIEVEVEVEVVGGKFCFVG